MTNFDTPQKVVAIPDATEKDGHKKGVQLKEGTFKSISCWMTRDKKEPNEKADAKEAPNTDPTERKAVPKSQGSEATPPPKRKKRSNL